MAKTSYLELARWLGKLSQLPDEYRVELTEITGDAGNLVLAVACDRKQLIRAAAHSLGCPANQLPQADNFEVKSSWYGQGEIDPKLLTEELETKWGKEFSKTINLGHLRRIAGV